MKKISELALYLNEKIILNDDIDLSGLFFNSKEVIPNSAFFCFIGTKTNGNLYIKDAIKNGAKLIITNDKSLNLEKNISYIISDKNIRTLYSKSCAFYFNLVHEKVKIIGVTGTDGKSTTCDFIYQLLKLRGYRVALLTTVNYDEGKGKSLSIYKQSTPDAFIIHRFLNNAYNNKVDYVVLETTSHGLSDEFNRLCEIKYISSCYTSISSEHLEFHRTLDNYYNAKSKLAENTINDVFIYQDNKCLELVKEKTKNINILEKIEPFYQKLNEIHFYYKKNLYYLNFGFSFMLDNAFMAASLVSKLLNLNIKINLENLFKLQGIKGRQILIPNSLGLDIIVDFAHTPESFRLLLSQYRKIKKTGDFIAVFGSNGERDKSKRYGLGKESSKYCSTLIITEDEPRGESDEAIANDICEGISKKTSVYIINKRECAIKKALSLAKKGDSLFLLGKGHENSIERNGIKRSYDEEKTILEILNA